MFQFDLKKSETYLHQLTRNFRTTPSIIETHLPLKKRVNTHVPDGDLTIKVELFVTQKRYVLGTKLCWVTSTHRVSSRPECRSQGSPQFWILGTPLVP